MRVLDYAFYKFYQGFKNLINQDSKHTGLYGFAALACMCFFLYFNLLSMVNILKKMETGTEFFKTFHIGPLYYLAICFLLIARYFSKDHNKKTIQKFATIDRYQREKSSSNLWIYIGLSLALFLFSVYFRHGY